MSKMGKAVIEAAANAGLHIVPVSFGAHEESGQLVQVGDKEIQVHSPLEREDILASIYDEYPELIVVDYTVPTAVNECQKEVLEAKTMVEEAERALGEKGEITLNEERLESAKAAAVCALVGTLAAVPIYLSRVTDSPQLLLQLGVIFISTLGLPILIGAYIYTLIFEYSVAYSEFHKHIGRGIICSFGLIFKAIMPAGGVVAVKVLL